MFVGQYLVDTNKCHKCIYFLPTFLYHNYCNNTISWSYFTRLSLPVPIDVVYTWVNGTDPDVMRELELVRVAMDTKQNMTRYIVHFLTFFIDYFPPLFMITKMNVWYIFNWKIWMKSFWLVAEGGRGFVGVHCLLFGVFLCFSLIVSLLDVSHKHVNNEIVTKYVGHSNNV